MGKPTFGRQKTDDDGDLFPSSVVCPLSSAKRNDTSELIGGFKQTQGTETSQYLEERTSTETPLVVASERGLGQWRSLDNRKRLERRALVGDSPVRVMRRIVLE